MIGIYKIQNNDNGKVYIGQSKNILHRKSCHKYDLKNNRHASEEMQKDYNISPASFSFEVLCECKKEDLNELEVFYIKKYNSAEKGYNTEQGGNSPMSEKTKRKLSAAMMGNKSMNGIKLTDEWKRNLSLSQPHKKRVECIETGVIYESFADASRKTGLNRTKIVSCCTGKRKTTGGFHFKYADKNPSN